MKFSIEDFFSKCDQIHGFLRISLHLLKKSLMENFIFCAVRIYANRATNLCSSLYVAYILQTLHSLHGQDSAFHFLIAILSLSVVSNFFLCVGIISQILGPRYLTLSES